jgi:hypothetical protein
MQSDLSTEAVTLLLLLLYDAGCKFTAGAFPLGAVAAIMAVPLRLASHHPTR